jgi:ClpP class serine protease
MNNTGNDGSITSTISSLMWLIIMVFAFSPIIASLFSTTIKKLRRHLAIGSLEKTFHCRIITLIHRQESSGLFGFLGVKYINMEDMESILEAIYLTSPQIPIYLIIHTPGGLVLAAEQIARALNSHKADVRVFVPHYAMSGGTLIGLGAKQIVMMPNATLGPVDPQIPFGFLGSDSLPAASIVKTLEQPNPHREDKFLALGDISRKALTQVNSTVKELLKGKLDEPQREAVADILSKGTWTHDYPLTYERAKALGLPVSKDFPIEIIRFMRLYKQPKGISSAGYINEPYSKLLQQLKEGLK